VKLRAICPVLVENRFGAFLSIKRRTKKAK